MAKTTIGCLEAGRKSELLCCDLRTPESGNFGKEPRPLLAIEFARHFLFENYQESRFDLKILFLYQRNTVSTIFDSLDNDGFAEEMTGRCSVLYCIRVVFTVVNSPFFSVCSVTLSYQRTKIVFSKNLLYKACKSTSISVGIMINIIWFCMFSVTGADEFKPVSRQLTQSTTSREWRQKIIVKHEPCPG